VTVDATPGGQDVADLYDTPGNDTFTANPTSATLALGSIYSIQANDFRYVLAYATHGGTDTASFSDSPGNDTFTADPRSTPTYAAMAGTYVPAGGSARSYYNYAQGFITCQGTSSAGGTDLATLYTAPNVGDSFAADPTQATVSGIGLAPGISFSSQATGFRFVNAHSTGGSDMATLGDSAGTDTFVGTPAYGVMYASAGTNNPAYANRAIGFATVTANSTHGGGDSARLYDSPGDDLFTASPTLAELTSAATNPTKYDIKANTFRYVQAYATSGGNDTATLTGTSGGDSFESHPTYAFLSNSSGAQPFIDYACYFAQVVATEGAGSNTAVAKLYDSSGKDTFQASPTSATLSGTGFSDQVQNFHNAYAYATTGGDEAYLTDSGAGDTFTGTPTLAALSNGTSSYTIRANSFPKVTVTSTGGTAGTATANLYDSAGNDTFWGSLADAVLSDGALDLTTGNLTAASNYYLRVSGYSSAADHVNVSGTTGTNEEHVSAVDYALAFNGTWLSV
jgi:hypothetical protein